MLWSTGDSTGMCPWGCYYFSNTQGRAAGRACGPVGALPVPWVRAWFDFASLSNLQALLMLLSQEECSAAPNVQCHVAEWGVRLECESRRAPACLCKYSRGAALYPDAPTGKSRQHPICCSLLTG